MQTCSYCGKENEDGAFNCQGCATELEAGRVRTVSEAKEAAVVELGVVGRSVRSRLKHAAVAVAILVLATLFVWQLLRAKRLMAESASLRDELKQMATLREENEQLAQQVRATASAELQPLQGTWEGIDVGQNYSRKVAIRFTGNSLHFQAPTNNEWADGTFTLPAATNPQQLRFTMKGCSNPDHIGQVIVAIFKIEDGTLTLVASQDNTAPPPETFPSILTGPLFRCDLKKVQPKKKNSQPPKTK